MDLSSVVQLGRAEIEKKITENLTVKMRTLTAQEYASVMKSSEVADPQKGANLSTLGHLADLQITTLAYATVSINGQSGSVDEFKKLYQSLQYPLITEIYQVYMEILDKQNQVLEELKKNLISSK